MWLGLLSYFEGGNVGAAISPSAQAPVNTASGAKRFVVPREMAEAAKRLGQDSDALLLIELITTNGLLH